MKTAWKFNTSLLEIRDFQDQLESLIKRGRLPGIGGGFLSNIRLEISPPKSIEDGLSQTVAGWNSLSVELARRDLERETSKHYKGFVVRSRLKRVLNEVVKSNVTAREEEVQRFPGRYFDSVKSLDRRVLRSNCEIRDAFWAHFRDRFASYTDLPLREFRDYLADFPHLGAAKAASSEGLVTECNVCDVLKQVGRNKSTGLDGLPYEVYSNLPHMFVPILTDMFNHWFAQRAIPGSFTKGVITLLKKGHKHVWEGLDEYRPITLLKYRVKDFGPGLSKPFKGCH